jgi:hypothetical protein
MSWQLDDLGTLARGDRRLERANGSRLKWSLMAGFMPPSLVVVAPALVTLASVAFTVFF